MSRWHVQRWRLSACLKNLLKLHGCLRSPSCYRRLPPSLHQKWKEETSINHTSKFSHLLWECTEAVKLFIGIIKKDSMTIRPEHYFSMSSKFKDYLQSQFDLKGCQLLCPRLIYQIQIIVPCQLWESWNHLPYQWLHCFIAPSHDSSGLDYKYNDLSLPVCDACYCCKHTCSIELMGCMMHSPTSCTQTVKAFDIICKNHGLSWFPFPRYKAPRHDVALNLLSNQNCYHVDNSWLCLNSWSCSRNCSLSCVCSHDHHQTNHHEQCFSSSQGEQNFVSLCDFSNDLKHPCDAMMLGMFKAAIDFIASSLVQQWAEARIWGDFLSPFILLHMA